MSLPKRNPSLIDRIVDGERVLLDRERGRIHRLNTTASFVWSHCDGATDAETIAQRLAREYGLEPSTVRDDVERLLRELAEQQLLDE